MSKFIQRSVLATAMLLLAAGSISAQVSDQINEKNVKQVEQKVERQSDQQVEKHVINRNTTPAVETRSIDVNTRKEIDQKTLVKQRTEESVARRQMIQEDIAKIQVTTPEAYENLSAEEKAAIDADPMHFVTEKEKRQMIAKHVRETYFKDLGDEKED